jgi:hypothetical protein
VSAIVGVGARYPGSETDIGGFWESLKTERNLPTVVPHQRWDIDAYYVPEARGDLSMYVRLGTFLQDIDIFDAAFFRYCPCYLLAVSVRRGLHCFAGGLPYSNHDGVADVGGGIQHQAWQQSINW